jgi:hypothetical protein
MRHSLLFPVIACLLFASGLFAQTNPEEAQERVKRIINDTGIHAVHGRDRVVTVDKANKLGLEMLLGLSKAHTMSIISHFDYVEVINHEEYPFIKDVIKITNLKRWDYPIILYVFIDSSDQICRLNYHIGSDDGMSEAEARTILEQLKKDHLGLNILKESDWEIAGWEDNDKSNFYTWEKETPVVRPAYVISMKTYLDDHLLPYMKNNHIKNDGIFTPIPSWMLKQ